MYTPIHKRVLQHVSINAQVVYQPDFECPPDIIDLHLQLKSKGEAQGAQYNGFIYVGGGGNSLGNIHLVRQVKYSPDRQTEGNNSSTSLSTHTSKPTGSHFSVTTEEEDQRGKGAPLCFSLITL